MYAILNPRHHVPSKEMKEYLKTRAQEEENKIAEENKDEQTWDEILDN